MQDVPLHDAPVAEACDGDKQAPTALHSLGAPPDLTPPTPPSTSAGGWPHSASSARDGRISVDAEAPRSEGAGSSTGDLPASFPPQSQGGHPLSAPLTPQRALVPPVTLAAPDLLQTLSPPPSHPAPVPPEVDWAVPPSLQPPTPPPAAPSTAAATPPAHIRRVSFGAGCRGTPPSWPPTPPAHSSRASSRASPHVDPHVDPPTLRTSQASSDSNCFDPVSAVDSIASIHSISSVHHLSSDSNQPNQTAEQPQPQAAAAALTPLTPTPPTPSPPPPLPTADALAAATCARELAALLAPSLADAELTDEPLKVCVFVDLAYLVFSYVTHFRLPIGSYISPAFIFRGVFCLTHLFPPYVPHSMLPYIYHRHYFLEVIILSLTPLFPICPTLHSSLYIYIYRRHSCFAPALVAIRGGLIEEARDPHLRLEGGLDQ